MKIEHELLPAYREHFQAIQQQIKEHTIQAAIAKAQIHEREQEINALKGHAAQLIRVIAQVEQLPASKKDYELSEDGTKLIGEGKEE